MYGIILYWITAKLLKKNKLVSESGIQLSEIEKNKQELLESFKGFNIKIMIRNNFDIKPLIFKLFYVSFWINILLFASIGIAHIYTTIAVSDFFGAKLADVNNDNWNDWHWEIGVPIINALFIFFLIRFVNDSYKLSLRDNYRNKYLKLLILDIMTLNIFSVIGILIFVKNRKKMHKINNEYKINKDNLNSQTLKIYFKLILKIEIITTIPVLILFLLSLIIGYFVPINGIKIICLVTVFLSMILLYLWTIPRIVGLIIVQKMFKNLINNDYYYLLSTIRFLAFGFGCYHSAILINFLFDEPTKNLIIKTW